MDNTAEDTLCILKEELFLVHIFSTPVCRGKTNKTKTWEGYTLHERSRITHMVCFILCGFNCFQVVYAADAVLKKINLFLCKIPLSKRHREANSSMSQGS